jgi:putative ABC transport system ATP-binding protein
VDTPTSGKVVVNGHDTGRLSERALTELRLRTIGFIFQSFNLVPVLSVFQNVEFPLLLQGALARKERHARVLALLEAVGLGEHTRHRPSELSGGQRQRVAVARALVSRPRLVLADEPTANLDSRTGEAIVDLMREMNRRDGTTFIFSTHDPKVMSHANAIVRIADGRIAAREPVPAAPRGAASTDRAGGE